MHPNHPLDLLGGLTPSKFMREYWQRKPLLIKKAFPNFRPPLTATALKKLGRRDDVESRLVWKEKRSGKWSGVLLPGYPNPLNLIGLCLCKASTSTTMPLVR